MQTRSIFEYTVSFNIQNVALLILVILTLTIKPIHANANDRMAGDTLEYKNRNNKTENTSTISNLFTLESFGTLDSSNTKSLGMDIWLRSDTNTIRTFMKALPSKHSMRPFYQLQRRLLLTSAPIASSIRDYTPPAQEQEDILSLRLETLLRMGLIKDAATLYKTLPLSPITKNQFKNGLAALLFNNDTALACLEFRAHNMSTRFKAHWIESLSSLCQKSYFDKNAKDLASSNHVKKWDDKSLIEKAILYAQAPNETRNNLLKQNIEIVESLPAPLDVAILLSSDELQTESKLRFASYAYHIGMYSTENLEDLFKDIGAVSNNKHLKLYQQIIHSSFKPENIEIFVNALTEDNSSYGYNLLRPLAPLLEHIPLKTLIKMRNAEQDHLLFKLAAEEKFQFTEKWINVFLSMYDDHILPEKVEKSIISYILSSQETSEKTKFLLGKTNLSKNIKEILYNNKKTYYEKLDIVVRLYNIDPEMSYENTNPLTSEYGYVMHVDSKQNRSESAVKRIKQNRELGLVVMLGSIAYRDDKSENVSKNALWSTAKSFDDVGLKHFANALIREAIAY